VLVGESGERQRRADSARTKKGAASATCATVVAALRRNAPIGARWLSYRLRIVNHVAGRGIGECCALCGSHALPDQRVP